MMDSACLLLPVTLASNLVHLIRRTFVKRLMWTCRVVETKVVLADPQLMRKPLHLLSIDHYCVPI